MIRTIIAITAYIAVTLLCLADSWGWSVLYLPATIYAIVTIYGSKFMDPNAEQCEGILDLFHYQSGWRSVDSTNHLFKDRVLVRYDDYNTAMTIRVRQDKNPAHDIIFQPRRYYRNAILKKLDLLQDWRELKVLLEITKEADQCPSGATK